MNLKFYFAPMSTATITECVLAELGLEVERIKLNIQAGDTKKPEFLKINPNGRVPAIVHEGTSIWESSAITMYLGEVFGVDAKLYPSLGPKRGEAMKWITWSNVSLAEAGGRLAALLPSGTEGGVVPGSADWVPENERSDKDLIRAKSDLTGCLKILNQALVGGSFLLGEYSLADTHVQGFVGWLTMMSVDLEAFPSVVSWMKRCNERPAIANLFSQYE